MLSTTSYTQRRILLTGSVSLLISVVLGAMGTHSIKPLISPEQLTTFETGIRYQQLHSIAIFILGLTFLITDKIKLLNFSYYSFLLGIILFSGSCYTISLRDYWNLNLPKIFFLSTPLGGVFFILGWSLLVLHFLKPNK